MQSMSVLIEIEFCKNCHFHTWCSHHDEIKYLNFFQQLSQRITSLFPDVKVIQRDVPPELEPKIHSAKQQNKFVNTQTGEIVIFPRTGAFQVFADGFRIYSKIKRKMWPKFDKIIETLEAFLKAKAKNQDLAHFDVDYIDPSARPLYITNSEPHELQGLFRVRKHKHQGTPIGISLEKRFSERNSPLMSPHILSHRSAQKQIIYFEESQSQDKIKRIHGWQPLSTKAKNVYLREIYAKGGIITEKKKPKLKLIKDELRGSITIQNSKGKKQIYYRALQKNSRQNSSKRKKLTPLQDSPLIGKQTQSVPRIQDNIRGSEPLLFNQFNSGIRPGLYRERKFLTKKKKEAIKTNAKFDKKEKSQEVHNFDEFLEENKKEASRNIPQQRDKKKNQTINQGKNDEEYEMFEDDFEKEQTYEAENEFINDNTSQKDKNSFSRERLASQENEIHEQNQLSNSFDHKEISEEQNPEKVEEIEEMKQEIGQRQTDSKQEEKEKIEEKEDEKLQKDIIEEEIKNSKNILIEELQSKQINQTQTNKMKGPELNQKRIQSLKEESRKQLQIKQKKHEEFMNKGQFLMVIKQNHNLQWYAQFNQNSFQLLQNDINGYDVINWDAEIEDDDFRLIENAISYEHEWFAELEQGQYLINENEVDVPDFEWDAYFDEKPSQILKPYILPAQKSISNRHAQIFSSQKIVEQTSTQKKEKKSIEISSNKEQGLNMENRFGYFEITLSPNHQEEWHAYYDQSFELFEQPINHYEIVNWQAEIQGGNFRLIENQVIYEYEWFAELEQGQFIMNENEVGASDYQWDGYFIEKPNQLIEQFKQFPKTKLKSPQKPLIDTKLITHNQSTNIVAFQANNKVSVVNKSKSQMSFKQKQIGSQIKKQVNKRENLISGQFQIIPKQQVQLQWHAQYDKQSFQLFGNDSSEFEEFHWQASVSEGHFRLIENQVHYEYEWFAELEQGQFIMIENEIRNPDYEWDAYLAEESNLMIKPDLFSEREAIAIQDAKKTQNIIEKKIAPKQINQIEKIEHSLLKQNMKQKFSNEEKGQFHISQTLVNQFQWYASYELESFELQGLIDNYEVVNWQADIQGGGFRLMENTIKHEHEWFAEIELGQFKLAEKQIRNPDYEWDAYFMEKPTSIIKPLQHHKAITISVK